MGILNGKRCTISYYLCTNYSCLTFSLIKEISAVDLISSIHITTEAFLGFVIKFIVETRIVKVQELEEKIGIVYANDRR